MTEPDMECGRAEELLSDHMEGSLAPPLLSDLESHLRTCAACRELRDALVEVVAALKTHPALEPPTGLAARAAAAALGARRVARWRVRWPLLGIPWRVQAAAAALAILIAGLVVTASRPDTLRSAWRLKERSYNTGVYLVERGERLMEDFRLLRVTLSSAFGGRVDRWGDRVEDYRRLINRRRGTPASEPRKSDDSTFVEPASARTRTL